MRNARERGSDGHGPPEPVITVHVGEQRLMLEDTSDTALEQLLEDLHSAPPGPITIHTRRP
jgi:hypothetical protein